MIRFSFAGIAGNRPVMPGSQPDDLYILDLILSKKTLAQGRLRLNISGDWHSIV